MIKEYNFYYALLICKYSWVAALKDKGLLQPLQLIDAFQTFLEVPGRIPNKIWVNNDNEFYNRSMKTMYKKMI